MTETLTKSKFGLGKFGEHKIEEGHCPECNAPPKDHEFIEYSMPSSHIKVYCTVCGAFMRNGDDKDLQYFRNKIDKAFLIKGFIRMR